jgi:hypothetical protein
MERKNMKMYHIITALLVITALTVVFQGCKYDVAEPKWYSDPAATAIPQINLITPANAAVPGVSTITIDGINFVPIANGNFVYFNSTSAEIKSISTTQIIVYRPNLAADSSIVKVATGTYTVAKVGPYRIDKVMSRYADFLDSVQLNSIAVDNAENLYVAGGLASPYTIWRVQPGATKETFARDTTSSSDSKIHNGILYLIGTTPAGNRTIYQQNLTMGGQVTKWTQMPTGKTVKFGDFGPTGYFYTGGKSTDLCIVPPNPPFSPALSLAQIKLAHAYATDEILAIRVYNGYVYVASRQANTTVAAKIWRHAINADAVDAQELVVDLSILNITSTVTGLAFSANGMMFITISNTNPLLVFDPATGNLDYFYKGILPPNGKGCYWGSGNYLYMISYDPTADQTLRWNIIRIDMGTNGAPYY